MFNENSSPGLCHKKMTSHIEQNRLELMRTNIQFAKETLFNAQSLDTSAKETLQLLAPFSAFLINKNDVSIHCKPALLSVSTDTPTSRQKRETSNSFCKEIKVKSKSL